ncbi:NAD-dependent epimerase/dehydratase family protein [Rothia terrae]|nr:NAD-dependent epimerase/dehydratase family protein [Rothia terrae]MDT0189694.1 NAD-dependent epimerase/dehydratase family protein [Rothia terrae]
MSTIAIAGASGFLGKLIVEESKKRGHEVVEISRSKGVDLSTGEGLADALKKADAVIDAS